MKQLLPYFAFCVICAIVVNVSKQMEWHAEQIDDARTLAFNANETILEEYKIDYSSDEKFDEAKQKYLGFIEAVPSLSGYSLIAGDEVLFVNENSDLDYEKRKLDRAKITLKLGVDRISIGNIPKYYSSEVLEYLRCCIEPSLASDVNFQEIEKWALAEAPIVYRVKYFFTKKT